MRWYQNRKIVGEIIADVGLGLFVNGTYSLFKDGMNTIDTIVSICSLIIIIIGATNKHKE